ncbi:hypothetical protein PT974_02731 [Cladobotryum mycophilum]|uniref:Uncharacterized protein n=1 Tax=Cladobotryum mycophilum TaxID=491253 RepID=A0ABR0SYV8_9HYPO
MAIRYGCSGSAYPNVAAISRLVDDQIKDVTCADTAIVANAEPDVVWKKWAEGNGLDGSTMSPAMSLRARPKASNTSTQWSRCTELEFMIIDRGIVLIKSLICK